MFVCVSVASLLHIGAAIWFAWHGNEAERDGHAALAALWLILVSIAGYRWWKGPSQQELWR